MMMMIMIMIIMIMIIIIMIMIIMKTIMIIMIILLPRRHARIFTEFNFTDSSPSKPKANTFHS